MDATYIKTLGMKCEHCGQLIEASLSRLAGVISAESDRDRGLTRVVFDPHRIDQMEIRDEIGRLGFRTRTITYPQILTDTTRLEAPAPLAPEPDPDVHVMHVRTAGLRCDECTALVERTLSQVAGVKDVTSVRALGLTSVLFDGSVVEQNAIVDKIRSAGFGAHVA